MVATSGDVLILFVLSILLAASFWYCVSRAAAWSPSETAAPTPIFDYVLYLGSLVWCAGLAYLENHFHARGPGGVRHGFTATRM